MSIITDYEKRFIEFYNKFSLDPDNAKTKLGTYANELEYVYTLSLGMIDSEFKREWGKVWKELTVKPSYDDNHPYKGSVKNSLYGKHKRTIEKYLLFFYTEYNRIKEKNTQLK